MEGGSEYTWIKNLSPEMLSSVEPGGTRPWHRALSLSLSLSHSPDIRRTCTVVVDFESISAKLGRTLYLLGAVVFICGGRRRRKEGREGGKKEGRERGREEGKLWCMFSS